MLVSPGNDLPSLTGFGSIDRSAKNVKPLWEESSISRIVDSGIPLAGGIDDINWRKGFGASGKILVFYHPRTRKRYNGMVGMPHRPLGLVRPTDRLAKCSITD
ncbi:MAG: hypothetical protein AAFN70_08325 [Planctomycetota bacterium]